MVLSAHLLRCHSNPKFKRQNLTSKSDVYRRQILTYKDGPRTERVKQVIKRD